MSTAVSIGSLGRIEKSKKERYMRKMDLYREAKEEVNDEVIKIINYE